MANYKLQNIDKILINGEPIAHFIDVELNHVHTPEEPFIGHFKQEDMTAKFTLNLSEKDYHNIKILFSGKQSYKSIELYRCGILNTMSAMFKMFLNNTRDFCRIVPKKKAVK